MAHLGNTIVNGALRVIGGEYVDTINGVTVGNSPKFTDTTYNVVSSSANGLAPKVTDTSKFLKGDGTWATPTDTNNAVTQTATSTNADYEVLFSVTADNTTRTEGARKNSNLKFNPSTGTLTATRFAGTADTVKGAYTANGGKQNPNYFGTNKVGFLMMNTTVNSNSQYKDWLFMDCYNGNDVGGGVAFGVNRQSLGAYIMRSASARESWAESAELLGTHNYASYTAKKTEAIKSISRSGTTFTATRCDDTTFTFSQQDNDTKNTAGSTDSSSKLFIIGATSQAANPQTYSHDTAYVGTDGCLYSGGTKVLTAHQSLDPIKHTNTDIPEGAANLSATATAHKITAYRNGLTIPYQMDNPNDGGMLRVRGTSESDCILELGTWDDSGGGETIQFNYYPTTSQVTPTYSVSVPKKSGTIALTSDVSGKVDKSGDTMSGILTSSFKSATFVNSLTQSAVTLNDSSGSFGGWICGPTKNGRIVLSTYQANDDKLYLGYGERGRTTNSYAKQACWNGATGKWECDITGNAATATKATQDGSGNVITSTYLPTAGGNMTGNFTMTGNIYIGSGGVGGRLNGAATNGGVNSICIGDDVWLGDCNVSGILGMKSTGANCGFKFFNSSGTDIGVLQSTAGKLQFNGSNICMASDFSGSVSAAVNATTCTINDSRITTTSILEPFSSNSKGNVITVTKMVVTAGQVVLTFPALSDATSFKVRITNV